MSKEKPRYKVVEGYEKEFNQDYLLTMKETFTEILKTLKSKKDVNTKTNSESR